MEIHHHPIAIGSHTERKKWTHYFWEFLMLFLAVFCGFLAEYQLEHTIEHQREKQYMETLLEDIYKDTAELEQTYNVGVGQKEAIDSVMEFLNTQSISGSNIKKLYQLLAATGRVVKLKFEDRTSSQLKNAGGMRLIRKKDVADSIIRYWQSAEVCDDICGRLEKFSDERKNVGMRLFNQKYFVLKNTLYQPVAGIKDDAALISNDPILLAEYANRTALVNQVLNNYLFKLSETKLKAVSLINVLKDRYHVK